MDEPLKDDEIVERIRILYRKNVPLLIFYAAKFVGMDAAEDVVQDVFLKLWNKRLLIMWSESLSAYLFHAVRHACLDYLKHQEVKDTYENALSLKLKIEELYYTDAPDFLLQPDSRLLAVYAEIERLPARCKEIFIMAYIEERKTAEIASLLSISRRTVEAQLYKALKTIREALISKP
jgi:RNA polymerase sigma-70 factor (ECF subfamily)